MAKLEVRVRDQTQKAADVEDELLDLEGELTSLQQLKTDLLSVHSTRRDCYQPFHFDAIERFKRKSGSC